MGHGRSVGAPERNHGIAVDADNVTAVLGHDGHHMAEVVVEHGAELLGAIRPGRGDGIRHGGGVDDVYEEHNPVDVAKARTLSILGLGQLFLVPALIVVVLVGLFLVGPALYDWVGRLLGRAPGDQRSADAER